MPAGAPPASPQPRALGQSWERRLPGPGGRGGGPRVPSPSIPLPGLPDEAFESLTQLQHIYVAHNKVSTPTRPGSSRRAWRGRHGGRRAGHQD